MVSAICCTRIFVKCAVHRVTQNRSTLHTRYRRLCVCCVRHKVAHVVRVLHIYNTPNPNTHTQSRERANVIIIIIQHHTHTTRTATLNNA